MRGFVRRTRVEAAIEWIDGNSAALEGEPIAFDAAHGRVLTADVTAQIDVPPFDRAAMDGYALRGEETDGASDYNPLGFRIVGEAFPGRPCGDSVEAGTALRIMTGAPLPAGADAVVPAEFATEADGRVEISAPVPPGKNVGRHGEDVRRGAVILSAGRRLRPQDVGLVASVGVVEVDVVRRPRVRLLVTGNELTPPGEPLPEYRIYESNSAMLRALVERDGGAIESQRNVPDDREAIRAGLVDAGADVVLVSGGSSVGAEDHAPTLLAAEGELAIHGVAMRPSSPAGMGRIGTTLVFLLPGNPVSCLCGYDFFAGRSIRRLGGRSPEWPYLKRRASLGRKIVSAVGRVDYCRVAVIDGCVEPLAISGASILSSTVRADGFVIVPAELEGYPPGAEIDVFLYDPAPA
ncbi:MAG: molybdopterin molybdotransferase MoeA [Planctomycetes bacterium]|nr:molybdopterin molybdotransferase MoeA [Planctomycetota bacterium]